MYPETFTLGAVISWQIQKCIWDSRITEAIYGLIAIDERKRQFSDVEEMLPEYAKAIDTLLLLREIVYGQEDGLKPSPGKENW